MGGHSEKNLGDVIDDGEMDAGKAEAAGLCRALLLSSPGLHLPSESPLSETLGTQLGNDLRRTEDIFQCLPAVLTPLTRTSIFLKNRLSFGFCITDDRKLSLSEQQTFIIS